MASSKRLSYPAIHGWMLARTLARQGRDAGTKFRDKNLAKFRDRLCISKSIDLEIHNLSLNSPNFRLLFPDRFTNYTILFTDI